MKIIDVNTEKAYKVIVGENILADCGEYFANAFKPCKAAIITDDAVDSLYSDALFKTLSQHGFEPIKIVFPHGEASKNFNTLTFILENLVNSEITKSDVIVSLGGGVTGDLSGFAAACYLRGMQYVQIPTTFLSAIDSSVGGKTGVNLALGKNLVGAFWQPKFVICDWSLLTTLPKPFFLDGSAEAIKYGMAFDRELFSFLANPNWRQDLEAVIARCIKIKADIVEKDAFDESERQRLNFGHTIGHAIEQCSDFKISHGHAVAVGMVMITRASVTQKLISPAALQSLIGLLKLNNLPVSCNYSIDMLYKAAIMDKKRRGDIINLVVPTEIGSTKILPIRTEHLYQWLQMGM